MQVAAKGQRDAQVSAPRRLDTTLVIGLTLAITVAPLPFSSAALVASIGVGVLAVLAWIERCPAAASVAVFCIVCFVLAWSGVRYSQLVLAVGLLVYALVVWRVPWLRRAANWVRWGSFGVDVRWLTAASGIAAAIGVWIWYVLLHPNIDDLVQTFVPAAPLWLLIVGGLLFSAVNAAVEEGAYRGVILHGLDSTVGPGIAALVLQAIAFGALHIGGFPRGWVGVGLATIYGLMIGIIRRRAGGMLAPWLAHVFTDVVIAGIVVAVARPNLALHQAP
jgi:CAAX protease family protein